MSVDFEMSKYLFAKKSRRKINTGRGVSRFILSKLNTPEVYYVSPNDRQGNSIYC